MKKLRIILADDHVLVRTGIRALIGEMANVEVVGEAGTGREALHLVGETYPDLALLDLAMPEPNGIELTEVLAKNFPDVKVVILSMHKSPEYVMSALRAGASGYVLKDSAASELEWAIQAVARGESYLSPAVSKTVIDSSLDRRGHAHAEEELTTRQREVLTHLVEGRTMKEIALLLGVSTKTVEAHRAQMMDKLKIHDVPGLVRYAMRMGLTRPEFEV